MKNIIKGAIGAIHGIVITYGYIISGAIFVLLGAAIAYGPKIPFFSTCPFGCCGNAVPICYWSTQTLIGLGLMIAALGLCMIIFTDIKTQFGLLIGIFVTAVVSILIPYAIIGGMEGMRCYRVTFPAIAVTTSIILAYSGFLGFRIKYKEFKNRA